MFRFIDVNNIGKILRKKHYIIIYRGLPQGKYNFRNSKAVLKSLT